MTDAERTAAFDAIKARVIDELCGKGNAAKCENDSKEVIIDKNFGTGKSWLDEQRITSPMNVDASAIRNYQEQIQRKGRIDSIIEPEVISKASMRFI